MKYVPPFGVSDPEANYINGDPTIGRQGSIPPAAVFENPQREIIQVISSSHMVPTDADLQQLAKAIRSQRLNYFDAEQSANPNDVIISVIDPPLASYTRGLVFRIRLRNTNTDAMRLNAGPGWAPIRKMNGADVGPGELSNGGVITVIYDGSVWQLTNYATSAATSEIISVKIPYTVDQSPTPNLIIANFLPALQSQDLVAGMMCAVKIANTNTGPTQMTINGMSPNINLRANGSSATPAALTLQGDVKRDDVVLFFYDGQYLWFAPNPEFSAYIQYDIGDGGQFPNVATALDEIRRKTIGANGYVDFKLRAQTFGPIEVSHPGADRIRVSGTLRSGLPGGPSVNWNTLARSGVTAAQLSNDYSFNLTYLQSLYGTTIRIPNDHAEANPWTAVFGVTNAGPGRLVVRDLLILGDRRPTTVSGWWQTGAGSLGSEAITLQNVGIAGCSTGAHCSGDVAMDDCTIVGTVHHAVHCAGFFRPFRTTIAGVGTRTPGNLAWGCAVNAGKVYGYLFRCFNSANVGVQAWSNGTAELWASMALGSNDWDSTASSGGGIHYASGYAAGETSNPGKCNPPLNQVGNINGIVTSFQVGSTNWVPR